MTPEKIKDARMGIAAENIQEILDAANSTGNALQNGQNQFQTPDWLARGLAALLPHSGYTTVLDPQCAGGQLLTAVPCYSGRGHMGIELDRRFMGDGKSGTEGDIARITGNCVRVMATMDELYPESRFGCIVANPPFAIRWKQKDGTAMDSTQWTWEMIKRRLAKHGAGLLISNWNTLERMGITRDPWVYLAQKFPVGGIWDNVNVQLGIVHFYHGDRDAPRIDRDWTHVPSERELAEFANTPPLQALFGHARYPGIGGLNREWELLAKIVAEEAGSHPKFNIYLNKDGMLRTYLSTRAGMKVNRDEIARLARINGCHPLTLTTERETRVLMHEYLTSGVYTIQPEARAAINQALNEVASLACPIRPVTDFECVAYAEEEEKLKCSALHPGREIALTPGKFYEIRTGTYTFKDKFSRKKVHYDEETEKTEIEEHDCELSGEDRYIEITDDDGCIHRFMDRPDLTLKWHHPEAQLWEIFQKPYVPTVAEVCAAQYERNLNAMRFNEMVAGFNYFPGQLDYYARMACKDYGLVAADVGCHAKGTPIMMCDGTSKLVEDVAVGDCLMGWDNTPRRVNSLSRGRQKMACITPVKGEPFVVNLDHILTLVQTNVHHSRKLARTNGAYVDVTVREYLTWSKERRDNHKLFRRGIELPDNRAVLTTFTPYFMGIFLGDGTSACDSVGITKPDAEIKAAVATECASFDWPFRIAVRSGCPTYYISGPGIRRELADHGLLGVGSGERFVPNLYKYNSRDVRLEVIAGLLDTDGHLCSAGTFDYISQSKRLADDVTWLARSLGLAAYVKPCEKRDQNGQGGTYHRVCISGDLDMIPTRIPRKQAKPRQQKKDVLRTGFTVELLPVDDFYGFNIGGDGRFLMGDFTVTHNTGKSLGALTLITLKSPKRTLLIAPQGTMRSVGDEDEIDYQASQWVKEIQRFAPGEPVFQLFDRQDLQNILHANGGELPFGIYISYPQAMFSNGAFEHLPHTWEDEEELRFCKRFGYEFTNERAKDDYLSRNIGASSDKGIRCIWEPSLATYIECLFGDVFEMVVIDEAHLCFPYSTEVVTRELGALPIGRIVEEALDVHVLSSNLNSKATQWKRVTGHFKNSADRPLVRVTHEHGSFICTDDHKVRVRNGWKRAQALLPGEELQILRHSIPSPEAGEAHADLLLEKLLVEDGELESRAPEGDRKAIQEAGAVRDEGVRQLPEQVHVSLAVQEAGRDKMLLRQGVRDSGSIEGSREVESHRSQELRSVLGQSSGGEKPRVVGTNEEIEPDEKAGGCGKDAPQSFRSHVSVEGRERADDSPAAHPCCCAGMADGGCDSHDASEGTLPVAAERLQGGHCEPGSKAGNRSGRSVTPIEEVEVSGPPQREHPEISRVVRVEVLQSRGGIADDQGRGADHVYCLEVEDNHNFFADGVLVSNCCNLEANITKNLLRLQPKYRFALTATPIPNIVSNIFSLMGWLCVPDWHKGARRNAAWPYAVDEIGRFNSTFLSTEVDLTAQNKAKAAGKKSWRQQGTRYSPIISSPARLLKLLKPTMAYISKEDCNPNVVGCEIIDVRVATGKEQSKLYEYWLDRKNYVNEFKSMLTIAQVQSSRLRGICGAPASLDYTRGLCKSNFNRKTVTILQLIRDCLERGEQVVVVAARCSQSASISTRLRDAGISISRIDSTVPAELHTAEANRFKKGDSRVMLMGIKCAQGHSFDQCPNLIIASLEWSYGTLHQAKGRVHRLTSPKAVKIWCVLHKNTIEELLFDRVALKQDAATLCLHGKRVPRDFKTLDASEILAEHIVNFDASNGEVLSESECESQWHALRKQLVIANRSPHMGGEIEEMVA